MAVVVVENPVPYKASLIRKQNNCGKFGLLCTPVYKPTRNLTSTKVFFEVQHLHLLPMDRTKLLIAHNSPHKTKINADFVSYCAGACVGFVLQTLQNILIKLRLAKLSPSRSAVTVHCKYTNFP
jgi:hypothetical protein